MLISAFVQPLGASDSLALIATQCLVQSELGLAAQALAHEVLILFLEVYAGIVVLKSFLIFVEHTVVFGHFFGANNAAPHTLIAFLILTRRIEDLSKSGV